MASITFWNRLEARPRSPAIGPALMARIRDPLWMLTRQWQFGEFRGEDAGSPAWVTYEQTQTPLLRWRTQDGHAQEMPTAPLEEAVATEPFTPNLSIAVELGQFFEALLTDAGAAALIPDFRRAYAIPSVTPDQLARAEDPEAARFQNVVAGRVTDGVALHEAARSSLPALPAQPTLPSDQNAVVHIALTRLVEWVGEIYGELGRGDSPSWSPEHLEYRVEVIGLTASGNTAVFSADPDREAEFDWYTFDQRYGGSADFPVPEDAVDRSRHSLTPTHVRFRGMPNARWWDFEHAVLDFGAITADRRDLAKLLVMDFMLVHGNDWFVIPLEQTIGSLLRIESLAVHDVFGGVTHVEPAATDSADSTRRWNMFGHSIQGGAAHASDMFILPPSASRVLERSDAVEDVRLLRDEMANMAWAIERTVEGSLGGPLSLHERQLAKRSSIPEALRQPTAGAPPLKYQIQTTVPENWFPLLPVVIDPVQGDIALELGAMLKTDTERLQPSGRILQPASIKGPYRIQEEEVIRGGVSVRRVICRSRWIDGSTHLWIARLKTAGRGEGSSGLRFDLAIPNPSSA